MTTTTTRPKRRRGRKIAMGAATLILTGAIIAAAAVLIRAPINGGVDVRAVDPQLRWYTLGVQEKVGGIECTTQLSNGAATINISNAGPGEYCDFRGAARLHGPNNRGEWRLQNLVYAPEVVDVQLLGDACGRELEHEMHELFNFRVTVRDDAAMGNHSIAPDAGLVAVNADDFNAAACPK